MPTPWLLELDRAVAPSIVRPRQRSCVQRHLLRHGYGDSELAEQAEVAVHTCANGQVCPYVAFVQHLLSRPAMPLDDIAAACAAADQNHARRSETDVARDDLLRRIRAAVFRCDPALVGTKSARCCPVCKNTDLRTTARQTRGADEGQTIFYVCGDPKCKTEFR